MRKNLIVLLALTAATYLAFAPLGNAGGQMPPPEGAAFWTYLTKTNPYTKWSTWPGYPEMYPGKSPHGKYLKLYANDIALKAAKAGKAMPFGAIIVKENYGKDKKTLMAVTPMYKVKGFNAKGGNWFWAKYGPGGKVAAAGTPRGCVSCHRAMTHKDWIFTEAK